MIEEANLQFEAISLERMAEYLAKLAETPSAVSDYSFANIWGWAREYDLEWAFARDLVWIRQQSPQTVHWAPVGNWDAVDWTAIWPQIDSQTVITRVPEALADLWQQCCASQLHVEEERGNWDYVYSVEELTLLKGNRFHKKKNLLSQFKRKYNYRFEPFSEAMIDQALALQDDWCTWRDCEATDVLAAENRAIQRTFLSWNQFPFLTGAALLIDDMIGAYTIAEPLDDQTILIHFEKGCPLYKGIYQAINQMFLESLGERYTFVNREQDLGDEGLRKAKLSYHPVDFNKKYRVITQ
jgi:hypothetical protein